RMIVAPRDPERSRGGSAGTKLGKVARGGGAASAPRTKASVICSAENFGAGFAMTKPTAPAGETRSENDTQRTSSSRSRPFAVFWLIMRSNLVGGPTKGFRGEIVASQGENGIMPLNASRNRTVMPGFLQRMNNIWHAETFLLVSVFVTAMLLLVFGVIADEVL